MKSYWKNHFQTEYEQTVPRVFFFWEIPRDESEDQPATDDGGGRNSSREHVVGESFFFVLDQEDANGDKKTEESEPLVFSSLRLHIMLEEECLSGEGKDGR